MAPRIKKLNNPPKLIFSSGSQSNPTGSAEVTDPVRPCTNAKYASAVALSYDSKADNAPYLTAKGRGISADIIVRIAKQYGIPVIERPAVSHLLQQVEEADQIPVQLYEVVATVLHEIKNK